MSELPLSLEIANFLSAVASSYPYGIPRSQQTLVHAQPRRLVFYSPQKFSSDGLKLVHDAAQKGLKLPQDQYRILEGGEIPTDDLVVIFGVDAPSSKRANHLHTFATAEILGDISKKRIFWEDLKRIWQLT